jgi:hypothetical protein
LPLAERISSQSANYLGAANFSVFTPQLELTIVMSNPNAARQEHTYTVTVADPAHSGWWYLQHYYYYQAMIQFYNRLHPTAPISEMADTFTMISGYRNYNSFDPRVSLREQTALQQVQAVKEATAQQSLNHPDYAEPRIFSLVKLQVAKVHQELLLSGLTGEQMEARANAQSFMTQINDKLRLLHLSVRIRLVNLQSWSYEFQLTDTRRGRILEDINSLSAGQKAIMHLVFEAYGRGALKGGIVVIDEPEIHLHYQFQAEFLRILRDLQREQGAQYVIVTHSESLIHADTIRHVRRFALDGTGRTMIASPVLTVEQRLLIKILDNTRSIHALFARKLLLVEGDTDRYLFRSVLDKLYPTATQEIAVLSMGGKGSHAQWRELFEAYGLEVHYLGDFDNVSTLIRSDGTMIVDKTREQAGREGLQQQKLDTISPLERDRLRGLHDTLVGDPDFLNRPQLAPWRALTAGFGRLVSLTNPEKVARIRGDYPTIEADIEALYVERIYLLKRGAIEEYTGTTHGRVDQIINFCETGLQAWLADSRSEEIREIAARVAV